MQGGKYQKTHNIVSQKKVRRPTVLLHLLFCHPFLVHSQGDGRTFFDYDLDGGDELVLSEWKEHVLYVTYTLVNSRGMCIYVDKALKVLPKAKRV